MFFFAAIDGNVVGIGTVSGALVVVTGYMLRQGRDSVERVDRTNAVLVKSAEAERDRAIAAEAEAVHKLADREEQLQIARFRIHDLESKIRALGGTP